MAAGYLLVPYSMPALTAAGAIAAGAVMTIYNTGTSNLSNIYANSGLTVPISNPLTANSAGRFTDQAGIIWAADSNSYDIVLTFPDGSNLTFDNLSVIEPPASLGSFAPINSPVFTGVPQAPTPATNDNTNKIATTQYVQNQGYAPLASPAFTGTPTAPTPATSDDSTKIATTDFVNKFVINASNSLTGTSIFYKLAGGLIIQAGQINTSIGGGSSYTVTFPTAFPNACVFSNAIMNNSSSASSTPTGIVLLGAPSTTQVHFQFVGYQSGTINPVAGFHWVAFGY